MSEADIDKEQTGHVTKGLGSCDLLIIGLVFGLFLLVFSLVSRSFNACANWNYLKWV